MASEDDIGVYRIVSPNGSCYVGATASSFKNRWKSHRKDARSGKARCLGLRRAFAKYGLEAMRFEILEVVPSNSAESVWYYERRWWLKLKTEGAILYNGEPTGTGSVRHTEETRAKISKTVKSIPSKRRPAVSRICGYEECNQAFSTLRDATFCSAQCSLAAMNASKRIDYSYEFIYDLYWSQQKSRSEIMAMLGISVGGFQRLFARLQIPMRTSTEAAAISNTVKLKPKRCLEIDCQSEFQPKRKSQKYCSRSCADKNRGKD